MTATLPPMIRFQPLVAGACLPGGKVYFYAAGTLTPQAAYAADGTTPLANPLTLDANGATDFRLGTGLTYKINVTDSIGTQVTGWPIDQITGLDGLLITLAAIGGASLIGDKRSETGAIATTQHAINANLPLDAVAMMGMSTAGSAAANTAALQAAIDSGQPVYVPAGSYNINTVSFKAGTVLRGAGKTVTKFVVSAASAMGLKTPNYGVRADAGTITFNTKITLADFAVDINAMPNLDTTYGIAMEDGWDHSITNVDVLDSLDDASIRWGFRFGRAIYTSSLKDCTIGKCSVVAVANIGAIQNTATTLHFFNVNTWQFKLRYFTNLTFHGCTIQKGLDKFDMDAGSSVLISGGDYEGSGYFIRTTTASSVALVSTVGNGYGGLRGQLFGGIGRPNASMFLDEYNPTASRSITLSAVGTTATALLTNPSGGSYPMNGDMLPLVGDLVFISGAVQTAYNGSFRVTAVNNGAHTFTYTMASAPVSPATGTILCVPDNTANYRYSSLFENNLVYDPLAHNFTFRNQVVQGLNNVAFAGTRTDGVTKDIIRINAANQIEVGDGSTNRMIMNGPNWHNLTPGAGYTVISPDGLTTKTITINNAGAITLI